jgi:cystathionine beta-lyase/cystathionine gamma-synthase
MNGPLCHTLGAAGVRSLQSGAMKYTTPSTRLVHAGEPQPRMGGAVVLPVFQSSTFEYRGEANYHDVRYIRLSNTPNHQALAAKLAAVEEAEAALVTASGMAAIATALLTVLQAGDHLLVQDGLYGGTYDFVTGDLGRFGITFSFIEGDRPESWAEALRPETRAIYVETLSNPLLEMPDLEAVVAFAREHGLVSMVDNTFPSPINFRPCPFGFDLTLHSATKYLNGHSDIVAGTVAGSAELVEQIHHKLNHLGGSLDPHACFLLQRGMKTLALRMERHNSNALALARFLEAHPAVTRVRYPGLDSHPRHQRARRLLAGGSGMLSFELRGGVAAAERLFERLQLPVVAPSLGGVETLVTRPATTSHAGMAAEERHRLGITDGLVRVSVGIEDGEELVEDFRQGLE